VDWTEEYRKSGDTEGKKELGRTRKLEDDIAKET